MGTVRRIASQGQRTAWTDGETVAIVDGSPCWAGPMFATFPTNARWECSLGHWDRYFATVHGPAGWADEREYNAALALRLKRGEPYRAEPFERD